MKDSQIITMNGQQNSSNSLIDRVIGFIAERKKKVERGDINCILLPFTRFRSELVGIEQGNYYLVSGLTKSAKSQITNYLFVYNTIFYAIDNPDKIVCCPSKWFFDDKPIEIIPIEWKKTTMQAVALFVFMGVGKMLGGVMADYIGFRKTTYLSLLLALPFLLFGNTIMLLSLVGVMLFSTTMPITVGILVSKYPKNPGFAFGITTVGLFLGVVPAFFIALPTLLAHQIVVLVLSVTALVALLSTLKKGV